MDQCFSLKSVKASLRCTPFRIFLIVLIGTIIYYTSNLTRIYTSFYYLYGVISNITFLDNGNPLSSPGSFKSPYFLPEPNTTTINSTKIFNVGVISRPPWQFLSDFNFSACTYSNCVFEGDNVTQWTDVVVVYAYALKEDFKLPLVKPGVLYVMELWEPPLRTGSTFMRNASSMWNNIFNLSLTYRVDSDIFVPYAQLSLNPIPIEHRPDYYQLAKQKTRSIAWFVSRCQVPSLRTEYVKEMQKYIDVDIYGACGIPCSRNSEPCMHNLTKTYKFYLSFENSMCKDYVTEKLFKVFKPGIHVIPVVRGGADYNKFFPKKLLINAADFKNAKSLALYLKDLGSDLAKYSRMLEEKDKYIIADTNSTEYKEGLASVGCKLCKYLNTHKIQDKVYNMTKWWAGEKCVTPEDIF